METTSRKRLFQKNPFTPTGRLLGVAAVCSLLAIVDDGLIAMLSHVLWLGLFAFLFGFLFRPKLEIECSQPGLVHCDDHFEVTLTIHNRGQLPCYDLTVELANSKQFELLDEDAVRTIPSMSASGSTVLKVRLRATKRGDNRLPDVFVSSLFPLSLFRFITKHRLNTSVLVAPRLVQPSGAMVQGFVGKAGMTEGVHQEWAMLQEASWSANAIQHSSHQSFDYVGSREYQPGVAVRRWDYASWARLGKPTVREFSDDEACSFTILVDTTRGKQPKESETFERVLSSTAYLFSTAFREGQDVRLQLIGNENPEYESNTQGNKSYLDTMRQLAVEEGAEANGDWELAIRNASYGSRVPVTIGAVIRKDNLEAMQAIEHCRASNSCGSIKVWAIE